tara:strand:- start:47 stop:301 length:255 start_codon:yes stop_codon:yes gene_type:complete
MFGLLNKFFKSNKLSFDDSRLQIGKKLISKDCDYLLKKGEPPIIYHITDVNKKQDKISYYTTYQDKENGRNTVSLSEFNAILGY